jgi:hypothetical protein
MQTITGQVLSAGNPAIPGSPMADETKLELRLRLDSGQRTTITVDVRDAPRMRELDHPRELVGNRYTIVADESGVLRQLEYLGPGPK